MKRKFYLLVVSALIAVLLLSACGPFEKAPVKDANPPRVSVTGLGEVYVAPDMAYVTLGVRSESDESAQAMTENNRLTSAIIAALVEDGIEEKDIQTSSINVYWNEMWDDTLMRSRRVYVVENMVSVTVRDIGKLTDTLGAALDAGANSVHSVRLDLADKSEALAQARVLAVENGKEQAAEFAAAAGITLGRLQTLSSWGGTVTQISDMFGYGGMGGATAMEAEAAGMPTVGGQMLISVTVTMEYLIADK